MNEHECRYENKIEHLVKTVDSIHSALLGTLEQPDSGALGRIGKLEAWKTSTTTRVKNRVAWIYGLLGGLIVALLTPIGIKIMQKVMQ